MTSCRIIWLIVCKDSWVTEVFSSGSNGEQRKKKYGFTVLASHFALPLW